jgi:hypothetical protein
MTHEADTAFADGELRRHLVRLLQGAEAHINFDESVKNFPVDKAGVRPAGSPHSAWELLEHIRIALHDIAAFSGAMGSTDSGKNPTGYESLKWPDDYWPKSPAPKDAKEWNKSVAAIKDHMAAVLRLIEDPKQNLFEKFSWGDGQTLLREALLIADHNAYHVGQLMLVRRMLE